MGYAGACRPLFVRGFCVRFYEFMPKMPRLAMWRWIDRGQWGGGPCKNVCYEWLSFSTLSARARKRERESFWILKSGLMKLPTLCNDSRCVLNGSTLKYINVILCYLSKTVMAPPFETLNETALFIISHNYSDTHSAMRAGRPLTHIHTHTHTRTHPTTRPPPPLLLLLQHPEMLQMTCNLDNAIPITSTIFPCCLW